MKPYITQDITAQRGFSMLEVLISIVIILIGVLGVAGIQLLSMKNTDWARYQSQAAILGESIVDAIQINPMYWSNGNTNVAVNGAAITGAALNYSNCSGTACSPTQQAGFDISNWGQSLANTLPTGTGNVTCSAAPVICTITINWTVTQPGIFATNNMGGGAATVQNAVSYQTMVSLP